MICSQEYHPETLVLPKGIAEKLKISQSSVRRRIKRKGTERAGCLLEKFKSNPRMIERAIFQDESDFLLQFPINIQNNRVYFKG